MFCWLQRKVNFVQEVPALVKCSVTRLGYFWEVLVTNFTEKVANMFGNVLGDFEKCHFWSKATFW